MTRPAYKEALNIYCAGRRSDGAKCSQIIKSDGVAIVGHTVFEHRYSRGETILLCRNCAKQAKQVAEIEETFFFKKSVEVE